ncbi:MAG: hypothetical protein IJ151_00140 [Bacteroidales bacterium]|nr:hypothetical protein [Bacteroidales bacterium]
MARTASFFHFLAIIVLWLSPNCSVKEEREQCPAILKLMLPEGEGGLYIFLKSPVGLPETHLTQLAQTPSSASFSISRERFLLSVSSVAFQDSLFQIPPGQESPELFAYRAYFRVNGEFATVSPQLRKEFCRLEVTVTTQKLLPALRVRGNWCGQRIDGALLEGEFSVGLRSGEAVCIPRQGDNSLVLDVLSESGELLRSFALGEYMAEAGYDWMGASLEDISLHVDYVSSTVTLKGSAWNFTFPIKIEL